MAEEKSQPNRDSDKFMLRFPDDMRERIADAAAKNGRSMNSEIIARLQASFKEVQGLKKEQLLLFLNEAIDERLELLGQLPSPASKAVDVLVRGKKGTLEIPALEPSAESNGPPRKKIVPSKGKARVRPKGEPVNKVILVGNLGREPEKPIIERVKQPQLSKGPVLRRSKPK